MKNHFKKKVVLSVFLVIISLFLFTQSVLAINEFIFSASDFGSGYVEIDSSNPSYPTLVTNSSSIRLRIEPVTGFESNQVLEKISNSTLLSGIQPITTGGSWTISPLSPKKYFFTAEVGSSPGGQASAVATLYVVVKPTMTAVSSCSPQLKVTLNWTAA